MTRDELQREIEFGLSNLERVFQAIVAFATSTASEDLKTSAVAFECVGYYNAIEHLILRIFKYLNIPKPMGASSHRDTLRGFERLLFDKQLSPSQEILEAIENFMAFRHVATNIYGFLVDWKKLQAIVTEIQRVHEDMKRLFVELTDAL